MSTFTVKFEGKCYTCGKTGHKQQNCWNQQDGRDRGAQPTRGQRGNQRGYNRGRGRGRVPGQPTNKSAHEQHGSPPESWVSQICGPKINQVKKQSENGNVIYWLIDSGCTDHIVKSDNYFEKFTILKNAVNVKLPDGKLLKATKIGNMKIKVKNYYSEKQIVLSNLYYVEGIKQNLLSVSKN